MTDGALQASGRERASRPTPAEALIAEVEPGFHGVQEEIGGLRSGGPVKPGRALSSHGSGARETPTCIAAPSTMTTGAA